MLIKQHLINPLFRINLNNRECTEATTQFVSFKRVQFFQRGIPVNFIKDKSNLFLY